MPLSPGSSRKVIGENIREMRHAGHPEAQSVAAALNEARKTRAEGGNTIQQARPVQSYHQHAPHAHMKLHTGPIHSAVAGRTDHLPTHVPSGSYVLPAHHVSGLGESNTLAGFKVIQRMFGDLKRQYGGLPYSGQASPYGQSGGPYGAELGHSKGGEIHDGDGVPCVLAGGEYVLSPAEVRAAGEGDMDMGHKALDAWVEAQKAKTAKTVANLPKPRRD
jgi:hypothetical protein